LQAGYTSRDVVWLVYMFNCHVYDWTVKDEWKATWHDLNGM